MPIATTPFDDTHGAKLFARIPEPLDENARRAKYEVPLSQRLTENDVAHALRGFSLSPANGASIGGIGIEVCVNAKENVAFVAQAMADIGAPKETVLEIETDRATLELSLAELVRT